MPGHVERYTQVCFLSPTTSIKSISFLYVMLWRWYLPGLPHYVGWQLSITYENENLMLCSCSFSNCGYSIPTLIKSIRLPFATAKNHTPAHYCARIDCEWF